MKTYVVVWECNKWGHFQKLEPDCRTSHIADLFNKLNAFLLTFQADYFPEVTMLYEKLTNLTRAGR